MGAAGTVASLAPPLLTRHLKGADPVMNGPPVVFKHIIMADGAFFRSDIRRAGYALSGREGAAV